MRSCHACLTILRLGFIPRSHDVGEDPTLSKEAATFASAEEVAASDRKTKSLQRLKALASGKKLEVGVEIYSFFFFVGAMRFGVLFTVDARVPVPRV